MKRAVFVFGGGAALIAAGVFVLMSQPAVAPDELPAPLAPAMPESDLRDADEIVVEGNRFTDTVQGYSGVIPDGWEIRKPITPKQGISLYSPQALLEENEEGGSLGCKIQSGFLETEKGVDQLIKEIEENILPFLTIKTFEKSIIVVKQFSGIKAILDSEERGYSEAVYLSVDNRVYQTSLFAGEQAAEECSKTFQQFISVLDFS